MKSWTNVAPRCRTVPRYTSDTHFNLPANVHSKVIEYALNSHSSVANIRALCVVMCMKMHDLLTKREKEFSELLIHDVSDPQKVWGEPFHKYIELATAFVNERWNESTIFRFNLATFIRQHHDFTVDSILDSLPEMLSEIRSVALQFWSEKCESMTLLTLSSVCGPAATWENRPPHAFKIEHEFLKCICEKQTDMTHADLLNTYIRSCKLQALVGALLAILNILRPENMENEFDGSIYRYTQCHTNLLKYI